MMERGDVTTENIRRLLETLDVCDDESEAKRRLGLKDGPRKQISG